MQRSGQGRQGADPHNRVVSEEVRGVSGMTPAARRQALFLIKLPKRTH